MSNNLIANNKIEMTTLAYILAVFAENMQLLNNTIVNNKNGLVLLTHDEFNYNNPSEYEFKNNIIYGNQIVNSFNEIFYPTTTEYKNSLVQGDTIAINNNLNGVTTDPMFVNNDTNYLTADYRLQFCSPLLNVGDTSNISSLLGNKDLAGNNRYINTIDIGAYEKQVDISNGFQSSATLTDATTNTEMLIATCEEQDWTYYTNKSNPDSVVFAIKWGANTAAKNQAEVFIKNNEQHTLQSNSTNDTAQANMMRNWYVNLNNATISNPVGVRFYFHADDTLAVNEAHRNANRNNVQPIKWYALDEDFNANTHFTYNNVNNGSFEELNGNTSSVNGLYVIQFDAVNKLTSGVGIIKALKGGLSTNEILSNSVSLYPNPTKDKLVLSINNSGLLNTQANILDVAGRVILNFEILSTETTIDVSAIPSGMYVIKLENGSVTKFTKQ